MRIPAALLLLAVALLPGGCADPGEGLPAFGSVPAFAFTDQAGRAFDSSKLAGKVWVGDFIFTYCNGPCPVMSTAMRGLQDVLGDDPGFGLVTVTVDPRRDTPEELAAYARRYGADDRKWSFLNGGRQGTIALLRGLKFITDDPETDILDHRTWLMLVDREGRVRGYYTGTDPEQVANLRRDAAALLEGSTLLGYPLRRLPLVNACLNGLAACWLAIGWVLVRKRRLIGHKRCMLAAVATSVLFLTSYLTYHLGHRAVTHFPEDHPVARAIYLAILLSHTILAVVILPLVVMTLVRAFRDERDRHRRIARWTLPIWMYVSVTGVVIYLMLYVWFPPAA